MCVFCSCSLYSPTVALHIINSSLSLCSNIAREDLNLFGYKINVIIRKPLLILLSPFNICCELIELQETDKIKLWFLLVKKLCKLPLQTAAQIGFCRRGGQCLSNEVLLKGKTSRICHNLSRC